MSKAGMLFMGMLTAVAFLSAAEMKTVDLKIEGMGCSGCVEKIKTNLNKVDGVQKAEVTLATASAHVVYDGGKTDEAALKAVIKKTGYKVVEKADGGEKKESTVSDSEKK